MDLLFKSEFDYLIQQSVLWKEVPFDERELAVWSAGDVKVLPKLFVENHLDILRSHEIGNTLIDRHVQFDHVGKESNLEVSFSPRPEQEIVFETIMNKFVNDGHVNGIIQAKPGVGKAQPYSEMMPTPNGITSMGELEVGTKIFGADGLIISVLEIHEQGEIPIYNIEFSDGVSTRCCIDHLWEVYDHIDKETKILRLADLFNYDTRDYSIKLNDSVEYYNKDNIFDPYFISLVIKGDVHITNTGFLIESYVDIDFIIDKLFIIDNDISYSISDNKYIIKSRIISQYIKDINIQDYMQDSNENRLSLLNFLTNESYINHKLNNIYIYSNSYCSKDSNIILHIVELCRSLGIYILYDATNITIDYSINRRYITNIQLVGNENSRCITVSSDDYLYLTNDYIVTHNTFMSIKLSSIIKQKTICIVPNTILEDQWIEEIVDFSGLSKSEIGVIQGSDINKIKLALEKDIIVVKIQSLLSQLKTINLRELMVLYNSVGLVFYDECHQSGAALGYSKTTHMFNTRNIIGLSATPFLRGINKYLMDNSIGKVLIDVDHQNLIPEFTLHCIPVEFTIDEMNKLNYYKNDYLLFLATHNMILETKDMYLDHLVDWVVYRYNEGHNIAILFSANKIVFKIADKLIERGLDPGIITGATKKKLNISKDYFTYNQMNKYLLNYPLVFPKRKNLPKFKELKNELGKYGVSKSISKDFEKVKEYCENNNIIIDLTIHATIVKNFTEREIMHKKNPIISNFKMLTTGYSNSRLSSIFVGTPLVGAIPSIQVAGRTTRVDPDKIQDVQSQFFFSDYYMKCFPNMHYTLMNNLKKNYPTAKFNLIGDFKMIDVIDSNSNTKELHDTI